MTSHEREQAIEYLLRTPGDATPTGACLDAETAAAWVEGRLPRAEVEAARVHAADCARCQALMASIAAATPADAQAERQPGWRYWVRWAAPAAAGAAAILAVAVWLNVRPTPTSSSPPGTRDEVSEAREAQSPTLIPPAAATSQPQAFADGQGRGADRAAPNADGVPPVTSRRSQAPPPPAPAEANRFDRLETVKGAAPPPAAPQAAASPAQKADAAGPEPRAAAALEQPIARPFALRQFVSPDPSVRWRLAGNGVERSTDGGTNWTAATRLDSSAISAGSAPGVLVCWLAGRAGVVFVATDGMTFRQVAPPAPIDLVAISAADASSATVTATDGRRFVTADGGASWSAATAR